MHALDEIGVAFIGPNENAMAKMGDKIESKILAKAAGVNTSRSGYVRRVVATVIHLATFAFGTSTSSWV